MWVLDFESHDFSSSSVFNFVDLGETGGTEGFFLYPDEVIGHITLVVMLVCYFDRV